ncbi:uncharacterized protein LOC8281861 [Ricinus communis]|uniref:uncharacterized protein LOC8281861 n=1 Tax=Ricinus communis TaxID=3988 RepID=UPI00201B107F|nr:uncharacterized protein LOC8281861 [Ricinus communis]XP_048229868.1 uncharacterized protein LOC8281861 [Ricinus communis]
MAAAAAAATTITAPPLDLCAVLSESKRIINAHSRHFLALSVLFLLPISFSITVFPTLQNLLTQSSTLNSKILLSVVVFSPDPSHLFTTRTLILSIAFSVFIFVLALLALGSITYSVLHGFYGRPVKILSAIKSAFTSFVPLLNTTIFTQIIFLFVFLVSGFSLFVIIKGLKLDFSSPYFIGFSVIILIVSMLLLVYLQLNWALVSVIVVVESSFGIEPLKRSCFLIKGMKGVALGLLLFFGCLVGALLVISSVSGVTLGIGTSNGWKSCAFVLQIVVTSTFLMLLLLYNIAANTVMYMYCKAVRGELAWEIAEEFAREYVSLPFDDGKLPHLVSVAYA